MKKLLSLSVALVIIMATLFTSMSVSAYVRSKEKVFIDNYTVSYNGDGTLSLLDVDSKKSNLDIPETIEGYKVTVVNLKNKKAESVTVPKSVKQLSCNSFYNLKTVKLLGSGVEIPWKGFMDCRKLKSIDFDKISYIGESAFRNCESLEKIWISKDVKNIYKSSFKNTKWYKTLPDGYVYKDGWLLTCKGYEDTSITSFKVEEGTKYIAGCMFYQYENLKSIQLPDGLKRICNSAFLDCNSLKTVSIPDTVTSVARSAFSGCNKLESVKLSSSMKSIVKYSFSFCKSLKSIDIPEGVTTIGALSFVGTNLSGGVTIPKSVKTIGKHAFANSKLSAINLPSYVALGEGVFDRTQLTEIKLPEGIKKINKYMFLECDKLKNVQLPQSTTTIGYGAFEYCTSLESITLPKNVKTIYHFAFWGNTKLETVTIKGKISKCGGCAFGKTPYEKNAENGCLYVGDTLVSVKNENLKTYTIKDGTKYIATYAFFDLNNLKEINIPDSVVAIDEQAIAECDNLEKINMSKNIRTMDEDAIRCCSKLTYLNIPDTIEYINVNPDISAGIANTPWYKNYYKSQPDGVVYIGKCAVDYKGKPSGDKIKFEAGTLGIGDMFIKDYKSAYIPSSVKQIHENAFLHPFKEFQAIDTIECKKGSYADQYAKKYAFATKYY